MSKFKQALMISVMVFLGAFVILSLVKDQMRQERQIQHYRQLDSLLESTGLDYIEDFNPFAETDVYKRQQVVIPSAGSVMVPSRSNRIWV